MESKDKPGLVRAMMRLRQEQVHSDVIVKCPGATFSLHKNILSMRSAFFERACADGKWLEGETGVVILGGGEDEDGYSIDTADALRLMFDYMYYEHYQAPGNVSSSNMQDDPLELHAQVYALADKYDVPNLKDFAMAQFEAGSKKDWHEETFIAAIRAVCFSTPMTDMGLRDIVVAVLNRHVQFHEPSKELLEAIDGVPGFGSLLWMRRGSPASGLNCGICHAARIGSCEYCREYGTIAEHCFFECDCTEPRTRCDACLGESIRYE